MQINLATFVISATIFVTALWQTSSWLDAPSPHGRYYAVVLLTISGLIGLIALARIFITRNVTSSSENSVDTDATTRPRQHYRLQFKKPWRPRFVRKTDESTLTADFSCDVGDISETGVGLDCIGVFAKGETVCGEIIFSSGRTAPVNGVVVRETDQRTCLDLHCTIDPSLLMSEQREQIAAEKAEGPRPIVTPVLLDASAKNLPSNVPKGICRRKRR